MVLWWFQEGWRFLLSEFPRIGIAQSSNGGISKSKDFQIGGFQIEGFPNLLSQSISCPRSSAQARLQQARLISSACAVLCCVK